MGNAYSFIAENSIVTYEKGCKQKYNIIPPKIQKKLDKNKSLNGNEKLMVRGLEEIEKDHKLPAEKRVPHIFEFEEDYEFEVDDDEDIDLEEEEEEEEEEIVPKKKKRKKVKIEADDNSSKKSVKKKEKKKRLSSEKSESSKKKTAKNSRNLDEEIMEEVAQEDAFLQEDAPSDDDVGDDDFSVQEESDSDNEELYEEKKEKQQKPKSKKPDKASKPPKNKESKTKHNKTTKTKKKENLRDQFEEEQRCFEECEQIFCPIMAKLKQENLDHSKAEKHLNRIIDKVQLLTPSFIKEYQIGLLIKEVRTRYKGHGALNQLCKTATSKMKAVYKVKIKLVPEDFTPKLNKKVFKKVCRTQFFISLSKDLVTYHNQILFLTAEKRGYRTRYNEVKYNKVKYSEYVSKQ